MWLPDTFLFFPSFWEGFKDNACITAFSLLTFFFHLSLSSGRLACSAGRAEILCFELSLKERFSEVLTKDIVVENVQLFKRAETPFLNECTKYSVAVICSLAYFLGSTPASVEELADTYSENFVSVGHCWEREPVSVNLLALQDLQSPVSHSKLMYCSPKKWQCKVIIVAVL